MAYINVDYDKVKNEILPKLDDSIGKLDEIIEIVNSIKIPERFCYDTYFRNFIEDLKEVRSTYCNKRELIVSCNRSIEKVTSTMDENLINIKSMSIKKRGKIINFN